MEQSNKKYKHSFKRVDVGASGMTKVNVQAKLLSSFDLLFVERCSKFELRIKFARIIHKFIYMLFMAIFANARAR